MDMTPDPTDGTVTTPASEAETPPPPIPAPTAPDHVAGLASALGALGRLMEKIEKIDTAPTFADDLEALAEAVASKVHAKIAPLLDALTSTKLVADVAAVAEAPSVEGAFADAAAAVREFKCIADGGVCPMHGTIHET